MKTNDLGIALIKSFEGCKLTSYQDLIGKWTIGFGSTQGITAGMVITQEQAEQKLRDDLALLEVQIASRVTVPISSNEFSALVCFAYNVGIGSFRKSTLLWYLNQGKRVEAAIEFLKWNKAGGKIVAGLTRRRLSEHDLFVKV